MAVWIQKLYKIQSGTLHAGWGQKNPGEWGEKNGSDEEIVSYFVNAY